MFSSSTYRSFENTGRKIISNFFQPKLSINHPNDIYEQEADAVAEKVVQSKSMNNSQSFFSPIHISSIQRKCDACNHSEEENLQRREMNNNETKTTNNFENYIEGLSDSGRSIPTNTKSFFESRMGYDFSNVKIHNDSVAAKSAQSINALAYTSRNNIVFNRNEYQPDTDTGKKLLAHELTHVVQQTHSPMAKQIQRSQANGCNLNTTGVQDSDIRFQSLTQNANQYTLRAISQTNETLFNTTLRNNTTHLLNIFFNCPDNQQRTLIRQHLEEIYAILQPVSITCLHQPAVCTGQSQLNNPLRLSFCRDFFDLPLHRQLSSILGPSALSTNRTNDLGNQINFDVDYTTPASLRIEAARPYVRFILAINGINEPGWWGETPPCEIVPEEQVPTTATRNCSEAGRLTGRQIAMSGRPIIEERRDMTGRLFGCENGIRYDVPN